MRAAWSPTLPRWKALWALSAWTCTARAVTGSHDGGRGGWERPPPPLPLSPWEPAPPGQQGGCAGGRCVACLLVLGAVEDGAANGHHGTDGGNLLRDLQAAAATAGVVHTGHMAALMAALTFSTLPAPFNSPATPAAAPPPHRTLYFSLAMSVLASMGSRGNSAMRLRGRGWGREGGGVEGVHAGGERNNTGGGGGWGGGGCLPHIRPRHATTHQCHPAPPSVNARTCPAW